MTVAKVATLCALVPSGSSAYEVSCPPTLKRVLWSAYSKRNGQTPCSTEHCLSCFNDQFLQT